MPDGLIVDLFAGVGWSVGLRQLGLNDIGIELDRWACATRTVAGFATIRADVATYPTEPFRGHVEGLVASPPCQTFSAAGKRAGACLMAQLGALVRDVALGGDPEPYLEPMARTLFPTLPTKDRKGRPISEAKRWASARAQTRSAALVAQPGRWIHAICPRWVALEQVKEALPLWRALECELWTQGYSTWTGILCAADYGVPQTRERAFLLAHRERPALPPEPTHCPGGRPADFWGRELLPWVSMADALGWDGEIEKERGAGMEERGAGMEERGAGMEERGAGMEERGGARRNRPTSEPAPAVTAGSKGSGPRLVLHTNNSTQGGARPEGLSRGADEPALTVDSMAMQWTLVNGNQPHAARRGPHEPAPTIAFGHNVERVGWVAERPATTIVGSFGRGRVAPPTHHEDGTYSTPGSIPVSVAEAAVLQGFEPDFSFQGTKTAQFQQVGNAVPPPWAAAIVAALRGNPLAEQ